MRPASRVAELGSLGGRRAAIPRLTITYVVPILVGGGKQCLPSNIRLKLELADERRFGNGMVFLRYRASM